MFEPRTATSRRSPGRGGPHATAPIAGRRPWLAVLLGVAVSWAILPSAVPASAAVGDGARTVAYRGVQVDVPASWPVYDLGTHPTRCVRFDVHAVYLGPAGPEQRCPAGLVGHAEALQVEPLDARAVAGLTFGPPATDPGGVPMARATGIEAEGSDTTAFPTLGVLVRATYVADPTTATRIVGTVRRAGGVTPTPWPITPGAEPSTAAAASSPSVPVIYTGTGFDACTAPSLSTMQSWLASPYRSLGIYLGGINRACSQPNLTASWVATVEAESWRLAPLWVGLQAPCAYHTGMASIDPSQAGTQGTTAADFAASAAATDGLGTDVPITFDMEGYDISDTACDRTVEQFLSGWVKELHSKGYRADVYSGASTGILQLTTYYDSTTYARPDGIWFAHWDGRVDAYGDPSFADSYWPNHQRMHQYQGGHDETWGGATINIDCDVADGWVATAESNRPIAFDSDRTGHRQIFLIGADGVGVTQITDDASQDFAASVSPDGTRIAYTSDAGGNDDVWVMNVDGTDKVRLNTRPGFDGNPSWSPDGAKLAFQSDRTGNQNVFTIGSNGKDVEQLTFMPTFDGYPWYSPDGTQIAFESDRTGNQEVWVIGSDGKDVTQYTFKPGFDGYPSWSPTGGSIAFASDRTGDREIWTIASDGHGVIQLTADGSTDAKPSWSPDATRVAYSSVVGDATHAFVIDADGSDPTQYTFKGTLNEDPSWA